MAKLVMIRHGQSAWNKRNLFTGWVDIPLSIQGVHESVEAGKKIKEIPIDLIFTSTLIRAQMTAMLAMLEHEDGRIPCVQHSGEGELETWGHIHSEEAKKGCIPVIEAWQLNERMYGKLQGLNKQETVEKYGEQQVQAWRRSFDTAPPEGESLEMTAARAIPYFQNTVLPHLKKGENVMISAHGNSLRSIVMFLDGLSKDEVVRLEIATGEPMIYDFFDGKWKRHDLSR